MTKQIVERLVCRTCGAVLTRKSHSMFWCSIECCDADEYYGVKKLTDKEEDGCAE